MRLYNKNCFTDNLKDLAFSRNFYVAAFSGIMPADVSELPFDPSDPAAVINNAISVCRADIETYDYGVSRFNLKGKGSGATGYTASQEHPGFFRVLPSIAIPEELKPMGMGLTDFMCASNLSFVTDVLDIDRSIMDSVYFEYEFHEEITVDRIQMQVTTDGRYRPVSVVIQALDVDGTTWIDHETLQLADVDINGKGVFDLASPLTTTKVRMRYGNNPGSGVYPIGLEFFTQTEPTTQVPAEDISWFMLLPRWHKTSFANYNLPDRTAVLWGNAGGPNEEQDAAFTSDNSVPGDYLRLLNLKLKALPLGDLK